MELLKVLLMPFQPTCLLFVAITSTIFGFVFRMGGSSVTAMLLALLPLYLLLVWLSNYAMRMLDDAANGVRETATASAEMMVDPFLDARCWVHPLLGAALSLMYLLKPEWPLWPTLAAVAVLFPASIGACAISGHALDAFNPVALLRVARGFGHYYLLLVPSMALCTLLGTLAAKRFGLGLLTCASLQMLLLIVYAAIGGALYQRRFELGFEPRIAPERREEREEAERTQLRQRFIDGIYKDLRVRSTQRAVDNVRDWLAANPRRVASDLNAILVAGRGWDAPVEYPRLLRALLPIVLAQGQPGLAWTVVEAGLAAHPDFAPLEEPVAATLVDYGLRTGRRRGAAQLLGNYLRRAGAGAPGPQLAALRDELASKGLVAS